MGLFTGIVTLPLAPVRGVAWVAEQLYEQAEREVYDEGRIRRDLLELEIDYEDGKIDEETRNQRESELLERLALSQTRNAELEGRAVDG